MALLKSGKDFRNYIYGCDGDDGHYLRIDLEDDPRYPEFSWMEIHGDFRGPEGLSGLIGFQGRWTHPWEIFMPSMWRFDPIHCRISLALHALLGRQIPNTFMVLRQDDAEEISTVLGDWLNRVREF